MSHIWPSWWIGKQGPNKVKNTSWHNFPYSIYHCIVLPVKKSCFSPYTLDVSISAFCQAFDKNVYIAFFLDQHFSCVAKQHFQAMPGDVSIHMETLDILDEWQTSWNNTS